MCDWRLVVAVAIYFFGLGVAFCCFAAAVGQLQESTNWLDWLVASVGVLVWPLSLPVAVGLFMVVDLSERRKKKEEK